MPVNNANTKLPEPGEKSDMFNNPHPGAISNGTWADQMPSDDENDTNQQPIQLEQPTGSANSSSVRTNEKKPVQRAPSKTRDGRCAKIEAELLKLAEKDPNNPAIQILRKRFVACIAHSKSRRTHSRPASYSIYPKETKELCRKYMKIKRKLRDMRKHIKTKADQAEYEKLKTAEDIAYDALMKVYPEQYLARYDAYIAARSEYRKMSINPNATKEMRAEAREHANKLKDDLITSFATSRYRIGSRNSRKKEHEKKSMKKRADKRQPSK